MYIIQLNLFNASNFLIPKISSLQLKSGYNLIPCPKTKDTAVEQALAPLKLGVVDDRGEQIIGSRGYYGFGAKITTDQDLEELLRDIISRGLYQKGFEPVNPDESKTTLKIELRVLEYKTAMGLWTGGNIGTAAVKAIVTLPSGKGYEKSYRSQKDVRTLWASRQETNARVINEALTEVINKMFEDQNLLEILASE